MRRLVLIGLVLVTCSVGLACKKAGEAESPLGSDGRGSAKLDGARFADEAAPGSPTGTGFGPSSRAEEKGEWRGQATPEPTGAGASASPPRWDDGDFERDAIASEHRPGLGTSYGEHRDSRIESVSFRRADPSTPDVVFSIHYDDVDGVRSVASMHRTRAWSDEARMRDGELTFALLDESGRVLPAASVGSQLYAVGQPDERYSIAVANDSGTAYEVVLSVDGLDVIDGRAASFDKRGYIVDPFTSVVIDGWRTSTDSVATFRFSSVDDSYAERMGDGRNVGVIGAAFFRAAPREWDEWRAPDETWRRETANPFPGNAR